MNNAANPTPHDTFSDHGQRDTTNPPEESNESSDNNAGNIADASAATPPPSAFKTTADEDDASFSNSSQSPDSTQNDKKQSNTPDETEPAQRDDRSDRPDPDAASETSDAPDQSPPEEKSPARKLSTGRDRPTTREKKQLSGGGVQTSGYAPSTSTKKPKPAKQDEAEEFDPAVDMPAFRQGFDWFVLRVAANKENSVRSTLLRKVQIEGLDAAVGRIMVPTEKIKTLKAGKTKVTETKLYPGYVFVEMQLEEGRIPQEVFFLIKETTGVGDFVGTAGRPTPMTPPEVEKMLFDSRRPEETPDIKMEFEKGDHVMIKEGPFENYEGAVDELLPEKGKVRVLATIFGRQAPIELEYWQIQKTG